MDPKRWAAGAVAAAAMLLTACGGGGSDNDGATAAGRVEPGVTVPTPTTGSAVGDRDPGGGHTADQWSFSTAEADPPDDAAGPDADFALPMGERYRPPEATDAAVYEPREPRYWRPGGADAPAGLELTDPCTLVTAGEFSAWAGSAVSGDPLVLEDGEACGFVAEGDRLRMAIGVIPISTGDQRFLPPDGAGLEGVDVQPATGVDTSVDVERVVWVPRYPVEDSGVLVVEGQGFDLVVEMSSRDGRSGASLRDGAAHFATLALGRLP